MNPSPWQCRAWPPHRIAVVCCLDRKCTRERETREGGEDGKIGREKEEVSPDDEEQGSCANPVDEGAKGSSARSGSRDQRRTRLLLHRVAGSETQSTKLYTALKCRYKFSTENHDPVLSLHSFCPSSFPSSPPRLFLRHFSPPFFSILFVIQSPASSPIVSFVSSQSNAYLYFTINLAACPTILRR